MARYCCGLRNLLLCVCTPFCCLLLVFTYAAVTISISLNGVSSRPRVQVTNKPERAKNDILPVIPATFWEHHSSAFWNQLQRVVDLNFNPILYSESRNRSAIVHLGDSLLNKSFFEVTSMGHMKEKLEELPPAMQKFVSHMQRRNYPILIQPHGACGAKARREDQTPFILFAIKSSELNIKNRQAIRQTWGQVGWVQGQKNSSNKEEVGGGYVRRVFLLGKEDSRFLGANMSHLLSAENRRHGDILQWDFEETFFNLTLKDVLFWSWFSRNCGQTLFVFKGDDDVFVNTPKLISYLHEELKKPQARATMKEFMIGDVIGDAMPIRAKTSKYFVPESFYNGIYPSYAGGGGVVYSGHLARRLHHISKTVHLYPIDDVFVGMCMLRLNALPTHHPAFLTFDFPYTIKEDPCADHTVLLVHKRGPEQLVEMWAELKRTWTQCRDIPLRAPVIKNPPVEP